MKDVLRRTSAKATPPASGKTRRRTAPQFREQYSKQHRKRQAKKRKAEEMI